MALDPPEAIACGLLKDNNRKILHNFKRRQLFTILIVIYFTGTTPHWDFAPDTLKPLPVDFWKITTGKFFTILKDDNCLPLYLLFILKGQPPSGSWSPWSHCLWTFERKQQENSSQFKKTTIVYRSNYYLFYRDNPQWLLIPLKPVPVDTQAGAVISFNR